MGSAPTEGVGGYMYSYILHHVVATRGWGCSSWGCL